MRIKTKAQMKRMLHDGKFGNTVRNWSSLTDLINSDYRGKIYVRTNQVSDGLKAFEIPFDEVPNLPVDHSKCHYYEAPNNQHRVIQGEIYYDTKNGIYLTYSQNKEPLRDALNNKSKQETGLHAHFILNTYLKQPEQLMGLLHQYEGAIIEFTEFKYRMGTNHDFLCIWEVRHY